MIEEALEYIRSNPDGVLQSDLWKALGIDSRKCSRIVAKLLKDGLITREEELADGVRTYRLRAVERPECTDRFTPLMASDIFDPCAGCTDECVPERCPKLSEWLFALAVSKSAGEKPHAAASL